MNMFVLARRYLKLQKKRAALTIIGILLATALVSASGILITSFLNMRRTQSEKENGTWHYQIVDIGSKVQADTLCGNVLLKSAGIATKDYYAQIAQNRKNGKSPDFEDNYIRLCEYDAKALAMMPYTAVKGRLPKSSGEIALPEGAAALFPAGIKIGDSITCPVGTAKWQSNGQGQDGSEEFTASSTRSFLVVGFYSGVYSSMYQAVTLNPTGTHSYTVYAQMKPGGNFWSSIKKAARDCGLTEEANIYENGLVEWMGQSQATRVRDAVIGTFVILAAIILAVMALVIRNSFAMSVSEKISQIGMLRCLGAPPKKIRSLVLSEALLVWVIALPLGLLSGLGAMAVVIAAVRSLGYSAGLQDLQLSPSAWPFLATALLSLTAVMISARIPAGRAMKMSMIDAVKGNAVYRDDRIRKSGKGRLLGKILGFPALLAAKNIRRNPKRFRTTVLSVVVSVTLFIAVGGFAAGIGHSIDNVLGAFGSDFEYNPLSNMDAQKGMQVLTQIEQKVKPLEGVEHEQKTEQFTVQADIPSGRVPQKYNIVLQEFTHTKPSALTNKHSLQILQVDRENYKTLHFSGRAPTYDELLAGHGALLYQTQTFVTSGGRIASADFANYRPGDSIAISQTYQSDEANAQSQSFKRQLDLTIMGVLAQQPWYADSADGYLLVAQENIGQYNPAALNAAYTTNTDIGGASKLSVKYKKGYEDALGKQLRQIALQYKSVNSVNNYENAKSSRNTMLIMQIFVYGFMAVITLICCVNVFNTVNANLLIRKREIAMTRAVGMEYRQMMRMLLMECALYGVIGTFWGSALGVPLQLLLVNRFSHVIWVDLQSPVLFVIIALLASVGIGILAGLAPIHKLAKAPIVEEIRGQE